MLRERLDDEGGRCELAAAAMFKASWAELQQHPVSAIECVEQYLALVFSTFGAEGGHVEPAWLRPAAAMVRPDQFVSLNCVLLYSESSF